jgi:spoIIIJ-associated protein
MDRPLSIEVTAADIESAISKGISDLGVSRDEVMVEVLEEPGRRLLGLGTRQAKVRLTVIRAPSTPVPAIAPETKPAEPEPPRAEVKAPPQPATTEESPRRRPRRQEGRGEGQRESRESRSEGVAENTTERLPRPERAGRPDERGERPPRRPRVERPTRDDLDVVAHFDEEEEFVPGAPAAISPDELAEEARIGAEVLREILTNMDIDGTVTAQASRTDGNEPQHWTLAIHGKELGVLIGRRGETLAAVQYITRLITSRKLGRRANLVVDVEGYKARREAMLQRLAERMAEQAVQRGRTVSMEPMPPHERRIIHLTLRNHPDVTTESVGEGDKRKVTVVPRRSK